MSIDTIVPALLNSLVANRVWQDATPDDLPRDANGEIDVTGAMAMMTAVVDGWVREHPEQWLWMHRRWRPNVIGADALRQFGERAPIAPVFKAK